MNKKIIIAGVAKKHGTTQKLTEEIVNSFLFQVGFHAAIGMPIAIRKFGTFSLKKRKARTGRIVKQNKTIKIKATNIVSFKPSPELNKQANKKKNEK